MPSEVMNLINIFQTRFNIPSSSIMLFIAIAFCLAIGMLAVSTLSNKNAILACCFIPITICTVLGFIPSIIYVFICVAISIYIARLFSGG